MSVEMTVTGEAESSENANVPEVSVKMFEIDVFFVIPREGMTNACMLTCVEFSMGNRVPIRGATRLKVDRTSFCLA